jgi:membrane protein implicated in regulation of membrane protease activity
LLQKGVRRTLMNKNFKVVQLNGLMGLFLLGIIITGMICGFVFFPIWIIMVGWNEIATNMLNMPAISYYQAFLLWICLALCSFLALRNSVSVKVQTNEEIEDEELSDFFDGNITNIENKEKNEGEN